MHTSQGGAVSNLVYVVFLVVSLRTLYHGSREARRLLRHPPPVAVAIWVAVALPSLVELVWHPVYDALSRQPALVAEGQVWRLLTSVTVQDSGLLGTVFNLVALAFALPAALAVWRPLGALVLFLTGALVFNLPASFLWHDAGGGSSAATFFLVASATGASVRRGPARVRWTAALTVVAGVALLALRDAHGEAVLAGILVGWVVGRGT